MIGKFGLAVAAVLISAAPAMADSSVCGGAPFAPAAVDGSKATETQMKDAHDDVVNFIKASDDYQKCLFDDLDRQKAAAAKAKDPKPLDQGIIDGVNAKVASNQKTKEKVGAEYNAAVHAYKSAHPKG
jgi:cephalosporin-C deacetylase-like acetyl esterase